MLLRHRETIECRYTLLSDSQVFKYSIDTHLREKVKPLHVRSADASFEQQNLPSITSMKVEKMRKARIACLTLVGVMATTTMGLGVASAEQPEVTDQVLAAVGGGVIDGNIDVKSEANSFSGEAGDGSTVHIPIKGEEGIVLSSADEDLSDLALVLPDGDNVDSAEESDLGGVRFENSDGTSSTVLPKDDGSVQVATVIPDSNSPRSFTYEIHGSSGGSLVLESDGSVSVLDASGEWEGGVSAPWATDADGNSVPTSYTVDGNRLTQHVEFSEETAFPVVADPWLGKALIKKAVWANGLWKYSPTLKVYPTTWGRWTGAGARWSAWKETLDKTPRRGHPNPNTTTMKLQFYCHFDVVRYRAPNKESWNLDTKIPNRGYTGFVKNGCN